MPGPTEHVSPDDLALRALGEDLADQPETHLATCAHCRSELDQLRSVVGTARAVQPEDYPVEPPPSVWQGVVAELGLESSATVASIASRPAPPRRAWALAAAAAVVGLLLGVGGTLLASRADDEPPVVASTQLTVLADDKPGGDAQVRSASDGGRVLELDVPTLRQRSDGFYEVWLLDKDAKRLVSIGLIDLSQGNRATFTLPDDVDLSEYPVVDVSVEPTDGDPAHSGDSIVRGTLSS